MPSMDPIPSFSLQDLNPHLVVRAFREIGAIRLLSPFANFDPTAVLRSASEAFALPHNVRMRYRRVAGSSTGYTPVGVESVQGKTKEVACDFWDITSTPDVQRLPLEAPKFSRDCRELFPRLQEAALRLFAVMDTLCAPNAPRLSEVANGGSHLLRISHYSPQAAGHITFPSHIDFGLLTLYVGGADDGLQRCHKGQWFDIDNPCGAIVIACGSTLRLYEPTFTAFRHRVVSTGAERFSAVLFTEPQPDTILPNGVRSADHLARLTTLIRKE